MQPYSLYVNGAWCVSYARMKEAIHQAQALRTFMDGAAIMIIRGAQVVYSTFGTNEEGI